MFPPRTVLVPIDFSEPSRVALSFGARLARHCGAELHVLHAQPPLLEAAAAMRAVDLRAQTREALVAFMQTAAPAGDWLPIHHLETGDAADVIERVRARHDFDVIVLGPRGLSGLARLVLGSTTRAVLRAGTASVFVVPPSWTPPDPSGTDLEGLGPVIVGIDDAGDSGRTLEAGLAMADALRTTVQLAHVDSPEASESARRAMAAALHHTPAVARATVHTVQGQHVAEALAGFVASPSPGQKLLCIGSHDAAHPGNVEQTLVSLVSRAAVPVLVVRRTGR